MQSINAIWRLAIAATVSIAIVVTTDLFASALALGGAATAAGFNVVQITDNDTDDTSPRFSGSHMVWDCRPDSTTPQICFRNGSTGITTQVTDDDPAPVGTVISGTNVAWAGWDGGDREIFFWQGSTGITTQITDNITNDRFPAISGSNVAWYRDYTIFFWNASTGITSVVTSSGVDANCKLVISGSNVAWRGHDGDDYEIFIWNGSTITQITDNNFNDEDPAISGSNVTWNHYDVSDREVFFWNGSTGVTTQITDNDGPTDLDQVISGSNVAWRGTDGTLGDWEIFFWEEATGTKTQITNNSTDDEYPVISGSNVAWESSAGGDREIYFWNGSTGTTTQVTNNSTDDFEVDISGSNLAWYRSEGGNYEIFLALPEPDTALQLFSALTAVAFLARRRRQRSLPTASSDRH